MSSNTYMATMNCGHIMPYAPIPQTKKLLFCRRCDDWRICIKIDRSWYWKCERRDCGGSHEYGTDVRNARRKGLNHVRLNPGHIVKLYCGDRVVEQIVITQTVPSFVIKP